MQFREFEEAVGKFAEEREWQKFHSTKNLILAMMGEVGELSSLVQWTENPDKDFFEKNPKVYSEFKEELADVFIYLVRLAQVNGVDLLESAEEKLTKNGERYTLEKSRGNAEKR